MFTDQIHPKGWERLFDALNQPCACEGGLKRNINRGRPFRTCKKNPLPRPGYRWYQEEVREKEPIAA